MQKKAPSYDNALKKFEIDLVSLQSCDHDPADGPIDANTLDKDPRPGEVEIPDRGSLHSTTEGFEVKKREESVTLRSLTGSEKLAEKNRSYQVNESAGTIAVFNTTGENVTTEMVDGKIVETVKPAFQESYTLNTITNEVLDYKRNYGAIAVLD